METLRRLTTQMRSPDGCISWRGVFDSPDGRRLLKGRKPKDVQNRYTNHIANKAAPVPASPPAPTPVVADVSDGRWSHGEEAELARLASKYTYDKGVGWKRMAQEDPEALARLTANRPLSAVKQKYKKGPGLTRKKRRVEEPQPQQADAMPQGTTLAEFSDLLGKVQAMIGGLSLHNKLKNR